MRKEVEKKKKEEDDENKRMENKRMKAERKKEEEDKDETMRKEAEKKKKEEDDATKAISTVVEDVNASESEGKTNSGNGRKIGRKTTNSKKRSVPTITIDEALQKQLHKISDSYKPKRNTGSMVKVPEKVSAEIVSKEEFEGKDVSEVTSKVTNTPKKRKGDEKEDVDEPVDIEIIKIQKQKGTHIYKNKC
ncbi:vicilin-like seed storage protein At2g18540 [Spinacia oleracea]|uniref:Vicilin-like seed storage protein At2g18540 n=1 Tax=Spinacia oleracea TaxID=3562 RepID=A0A9R0K3A1_SPIOL|nr:vicilin-like seed storage protein At2g18540 [Spinacia oleracea]